MSGRFSPPLGLCCCSPHFPGRCPCPCAHLPPTAHAACWARCCSSSALPPGCVESPPRCTAAAAAGLPLPAPQHAAWRGFRENERQAGACAPQAWRLLLLCGSPRAASGAPPLAAAAPAMPPPWPACASVPTQVPPRLPSLQQTRLGAGGMQAGIRSHAGHEQGRPRPRS